MGHSYDTLPAAVDAESPLSPSDLLVLRHQFDAESAKGWCSVQTKFNLAWGLVKSSDKAFVSEGVEMFMDIYRTEPPRRRECLYFLAVGHYKLGSFTEAKRYNCLLLEKEPKNFQAQSLRDLIDNAVAKEGYIGIAIAAGATAIGGVLLAALLGGAKGRR